MPHIKNVNLECIDYYRIQVVHKTPNDKHKICVQDNRKVGGRDSIVFIRFSEESIMQNRVRNHCLINCKVVLMPNEQVPREIYPTFEMTQGRKYTIHQ